MKPRFSKATVLACLEKIEADINAEHTFDPRNGWNQIMERGEMFDRQTVEKMVARAVEYGRLQAVEALIRDISEKTL